MRGRTCLTFALILAGSSLVAPRATLASTKTSTINKPFAYNTDGVVDIGANPASVTGPAVLQFQGVTHAMFNPQSTQPITLGQFVAEPSTVGGQTTTYNATPFEVEIQTPEFDKTSSVPLLSQIFSNYSKALGLKSKTENSLMLKGVLNGTVSPTGVVNVVATVDSIKLGAINANSPNAKLHFAFPIHYSQFTLPSGWVMSSSSANITAPASSSNQPVSAAVVSSATSTTGTTTTSTSTTTPAPVPAAESVVVTPSGPVASAIAASGVVEPIPAPEPSTFVVFGAAAIGLFAIRRRGSGTRSRRV